MGLSRREKDEKLMLCKAILRIKRDEFLDAYLKYTESQDTVSKKVLERKALDLSMIDPNFTFFIGQTRDPGEGKSDG